MTLPLISQTQIWIIVFATLEPNFVFQWCLRSQQHLKHVPKILMLLEHHLVFLKKQKHRTAIFAIFKKENQFSDYLTHILSDRFRFCTSVFVFMIRVTESSTSNTKVHQRLSLLVTAICKKWLCNNFQSSSSHISSLSLELSLSKSASWNPESWPNYMLKEIYSWI